MVTSREICCSSNWKFGNLMIRNIFATFIDIESGSVMDSGKSESDML